MPGLFALRDPEGELEFFATKHVYDFTVAGSKEDKRRSRDVLETKFGNENIMFQKTILFAAVFGIPRVGWLV